jgi:hypothetical protein
MTIDPKQERKSEETPEAASARQEEQAVRTHEERATGQGLPQPKGTGQERRKDQDRRTDGALRTDQDRGTDQDRRTDPLSQERSGAAAGQQAGRVRTPEVREDVKSLHAREPQEAARPVRDPGTASDSTPEHKVPGQRGQDASARLLPKGETEKLTQRLQEALNTFVDEPRRSVEEAASVLEDAAEHLTSALSERHRSLRAGWDGNSTADKSGSAGSSDTEDLRLALQTYREVTERLLKL